MGIRLVGRGAVVVALVTLCGAAVVLPARGARARDPVTVQLKGPHQAEFAGLYVADARRFYRAEGLDVRHREWRLGDRSPVEQVASGAAEFGITSQAQFLVAREQGAPIVAVAAVYQRSPVAFLTLKGSTITHPRDFAGKTIAFAPAHDVPLQALLKRFGMGVQDLKRVPYGADLAPFYRGETAIWAGHALTHPVEARLAGHEVNVIVPDEHGVRGYDQILFTTEELVRRKPAMVEAWVRASVRGWRYAIEHVDEATTITCALNARLTRDRQAAVLRASTPLIRTGEQPIGWMTRDVWQAAAERLRDHKVLARVPPLDRLYTTAFLERASR